VLPGFHAVQYLLLPFRGQGVEMLQPLLELLLTRARKTPESRIVFERAALLV
jgi:hypothetical protein